VRPTPSGAPEAKPREAGVRAVRDASDCQHLHPLSSTLHTPMGDSARLGIGTAPFAPGYGLVPTPAKSTAVALLRTAIDAGVCYIDTAAAYGEAECIVGEIADVINAKGVRVCTKLAPESFRARTVSDSVAASLARLRLPAVDTLMLHNADAAAFDDQRTNTELSAIVASGLVRRLGASTYGTTDARRALGRPWCRAIQVEHSILNPSVLRGIGAAPHRAEVIARSVLCKGLLTERRQAASRVAAELWDTLDALDRLAAEWEWTLPEVAIRFALDTPGVDIVLVGISTESELEMALQAAARPAMGTSQRAMLAKFDRADADAAHPERWPLFTLARA
jgi:aryl-alcohol dehydrogenase-like predicted oxidoreductase